MPVNMATMSIHGPSTSPIRRKPQHTYRSPSSNHSDTSTIMLQRLSSASSSTSSSKLKSKQASTSTKPPQQPRTNISNARGHPSIAKRKRYPMNPPLPLYHPLGPLALSLPPLDAAAYGLPPIPNSMLEATSVLSLGSGQDEEPPVSPTASGSPLTSAPAATRDAPKDKPTPRRRRAGGGGQRRKRKEPDDSDAPYPNPPKRTRHPRGGAKEPRSSSTALAAADSGSPTESVSGFGIGDITPTLEAKADLPEELAPITVTERRTTRSRNPAKRRDSSSTSEVATPTGETSKGSLSDPTRAGGNFNDVVTPMAVDGEEASKSVVEEVTEKQPAQPLEEAVKDLIEED